MKHTSFCQLSLSVGGGAAAFLISALVLRWNLLFCALIAVGLYFALWFLLAPPPPPTPAAAAEQANAPDAILAAAREDLATIQSAADRIQAPGTRENAQRLAQVGGKILAYLQQHPDKIKTARRFLSYYLDTVGRILTQYVQNQDSGLQTPEVLAFQQKTNSLLPQLCTGFENQLGDLMAADQFDVEADMSVIENLLHTEDFH